MTEDITFTQDDLEMLEAMGWSRDAKLLEIISEADDSIEVRQIMREADERALWEEPASTVDVKTLAHELMGKTLFWNDVNTAAAVNSESILSAMHQEQEVQKHELRRAGWQTVRVAGCPTELWRNPGTGKNVTFGMAWQELERMYRIPLPDHEAFQAIDALDDAGWTHQYDQRGVMLWASPERPNHWVPLRRAWEILKEEEGRL